MKKLYGVFSASIFIYYFEKKTYKEYGKALYLYFSLKPMRNEENVHSTEPILFVSFNIYLFILKFIQWILGLTEKMCGLIHSIISMRATGKRRRRRKTPIIKIRCVSHTHARRRVVSRIKTKIQRTIRNISEVAAASASFPGQVLPT